MTALMLAVSIFKTRYAGSWRRRSTNLGANASAASSAPTAPTSA